MEEGTAIRGTPPLKGLGIKDEPGMDPPGSIAKRDDAAGEGIPRARYVSMRIVP